MAKTSKTTTTPEVWAQRYLTASSNQAKMFKRFSNWYDSLYAVVGVTPSPWRSKMYVPVLARQTWALVSKFLAIKPTFQVKLSKPEFSEEDIDDKAEKARRKLEYDYENPYMDESMRDKLFAPLLDAVVTGTGIAKVCWRVENKVRYERMTDKYGNVDLTKEKKKTKKVSYNDIEPVNIFNVFVSPSAKNLYSAPWIIIKEFKTISELQAVNDAQGVQIYKNLDQLGGVAGYDDDMNSYNYSRNRLMNQQDRQDKTIDMVKLYECYEGDNIYTYAESQGEKSDNDQSNWVLIREQSNPYWHGKYPLVKFHVKARPFQFWGEGLFETTYRLQAGYNDVFNHFLDQWNLSENSMLMTSERNNINDYVIEPGGVITYRGDQPPTQFKHAPPDHNNFSTILTYMDQAIEGVTISQYAAGNPNSATDKTQGTATGIEHLQAAAGDVVSFMRNNFTQSVTQIGRMWLSNNQQYMTEPVNLIVNNNGNRSPMTISPQDLQGDMDLFVDEASMDPSTLPERRQAFIIYTQQLEALRLASTQQAQQTKFATDPLYINYAAQVQQYSEIMGHPNYEKLLVSQEDMQKATQASQAPTIMPNEKFIMDINELYGSEASQYLQKNGVQPDPQRQQQVPVSVAKTQNDTVRTQATAMKAQQQAPQQDPSQVTPDHMMQAAQQQHQMEMAAQQQDHNQQMDIAKAAMAHHKNTQDTQIKQDMARQTLLQKVLGNNTGAKNGPSSQA
jgi:hypothetical protein